MKEKVLFDIQPEINSINQANESMKEKMIRLVRTLTPGESYVISGDTGGDGVQPIDWDNDTHWAAIQEYNMQHDNDHTYSLLVNVVAEFVYSRHVESEEETLESFVDAITNATNPLDTGVYFRFNATLNGVPATFVLNIEHLTKLNHNYTEHRASKRRNTGSTLGGTRRRKHKQ